MAKLKILYVDHEKEKQINFSIAFKKYFNIFTAESGSAALEFFEKTQDIAIVVADQHMPIMTGVELLKRIKDLEEDTVRIVLSDYNDVETMLDLINEGKIYHYVIEPWNEIELKQILHKAGDVYRLTQENKRLLNEINQKKQEFEADIVRRKRREGIFLRRDMVLAAVNDMARLMLINRDWKSYIEGLMGRMGLVMGLSRIFTFQFTRNRNADISTKPSFSWVASEGVPKEISDPFPSNFSIESSKLKSWDNHFLRGEMIYGNTSSFNDANVVSFLQSRKVVSFVLAPIMVKSRCWGVICFEDCLYEREWPAAELEALRTAANLIGTSIMRDSIEENLAAHQAQLAHAGRLTALGEMASSLAHEIHQPLTVINLGAETCKSWFDMYAADSYAAEAAAEILTHVKKISQIVDSLRAFSRGSSGNCQDAALQGPLREAMNFFRVQFKLHGIEYVEEIAEHLPFVRTDTRKFEQIVVNLLSNARYAVEKRQQTKPLLDKRIFVSLVMRKLSEDEFSAMYFKSSATCPHRAIILSIRDNGIGMAPDVVNRCFEPFFTTKDVGEGTGLGLSVTLALIKELHFHLTVESREDEGTEFVVVIPVDSKKFV